jgi:hypothetical protein
MYDIYVRTWLSFGLPEHLMSGTSSTTPFPEQETALAATIDRDNGERGHSPENVAP